MGEELQVSDCYITFANGESHKLNVNSITVDRAYGNDHTSYPAISSFRGTGNMTITHINKYEFFKMLNKYIKGDEWIAKQYKHLKRCKNRKVLHENRR